MVKGDKMNDNNSSDDLFSDINAFFRGEYTKPAAKEPELPKNNPGKLERAYKQEPVIPQESIDEANEKKCSICDV